MGSLLSTATGDQPDSLVPIIDIGDLTSNDDAAKLALAKRIGKACEEIGFFIVVNHGVPKGVVDKVWTQTLNFFDQPLEEKCKLISDDEAKYPYGYSMLGAETLSRGKSVDNLSADDSPDSKPAGDMKEMFNMGPCDERAGMPQRRMPSEPAGFPPAFERYYEEANMLAHRLLGAFALALDLPEDWFVQKMDKHISALRANNYPSQQGVRVPPGSIRCSAHTDYGTLTILKSGGPGLQVSKDKDDPVWHDVPYVEDGFVINLGDLMRRWTNDRWSSTLHRVVNPPTGQETEWGRRLAIAFFHNLNKDAKVEAIPSCVDDQHPSRYDSIVAGDFLMLKHLASQGKAEADAHLKVRDG